MENEWKINGKLMENEWKITPDLHFGTVRGHIFQVESAIHQSPPKVQQKLPNLSAGRRDSTVRAGVWN